MESVSHVEIERNNMIQNSDRELVRINMGCGRTPTDGWLNYDNSLSTRLAKLPWLLKIFYRMNIIDERQRAYIQFAQTHCIIYGKATKKIPVADNSADVLYSSHMLEHLDREAIVKFFLEVKRVLCPGGILRVVLPDLKIQVEKYLKHNDADKFIAGTLLCSPWPRTLTDRLRLLLVGPRNHQWMYDGRSLCLLLDKNGFKNPKIMSPGQTGIPNPGQLDLYERSSESVYVEAIVP